MNARAFTQLIQQTSGYAILFLHATCNGTMIDIEERGKEDNLRRYQIRTYDKNCHSVTHFHGEILACKTNATVQRTSNQAGRLCCSGVSLHTCSFRQTSRKVSSMPPLIHTLFILIHSMWQLIALYESSYSSVERSNQKRCVEDVCLHLHTVQLALSLLLFSYQYFNSRAHHCSVAMCITISKLKQSRPVRFIDP